MNDILWYTDMYIRIGYPLDGICRIIASFHYCFRSCEYHRFWPTHGDYDMSDGDSSNEQDRLLVRVSNRALEQLQKIGTAAKGLMNSQS